MYRLPTILFILLLAVAGPTARAQSIAVPQGVGGNSFNCETTESDGVLCSCEGVRDCTIMAKSGVCDGKDGRKDDTGCNPALGFCNCTLGGARVTLGPDLRPKADAAATRNAPKVRDHRTRDRAPAAGKAKEPVRRDHRDDAVVPMN